MRHSASRRSWAAALALLAVLVLAPQAGFAAVPQTINYQGSLSDSVGDPAVGPVDITFRLYDSLSAGTLLWSEAHTGVVLTNGVFNVTLGATTAFGANLFDNQVYLSIQVAPDIDEMTPRQPITAVGYALRAVSVENDADTLAGLSCTSGQIASWNGASWVCAADADTPALTEGQVETFVTNGAVNLFAGTTLGGAAIQTGTDAGLTNVTWVSNPTAIGAGASLTATASCGGGDVALGGGWFGDDVTVTVHNSYPDTLANPATAWKVDAKNSDAVAHNITPYVICATP